MLLNNHKILLAIPVSLIYLSLMLLTLTQSYRDILKNDVRNRVSSRALSKLQANMIRSCRRTAIFMQDMDESFSAIVDSTYVPPEVGVEIYAGTVAGLVPIVWATYEFSKRIIIQRECAVCKGSGLTNTLRNGDVNSMNKLRKCWSCGGFIPWLGWKRFFLSSFLDIGNGGVLQRPAADYKETNKKLKMDSSDNIQKKKKR